MLHVWNIYTYIYHKFKPNVGKYSIHGAYGYPPCILPETNVAPENDEIPKGVSCIPTINSCRCYVSFLECISNQ